jgi:protein-disulfide isomerase
MTDGNMDDYLKNNDSNSDTEEKKEGVKMEEKPKPIETGAEAEEGKGMNFWKVAAIVLAIALIASVFTGFNIKDITGGTTLDVSREPDIQLTVVNDPDCTACDDSQIIEVTQTEIFPSAVIKKVDYDSKEGKELIEKYDITMLPAYLFNSDVKDAANFPQLQNVLIDKGDMYMIDPSASGAAKALNPPKAGDSPSKGSKTAPVTIIEFSEFMCPYCSAASGFNEDVMNYLKSGDSNWEAPIPKIMEEYVKDGKVRIVFKNFIVHGTAIEPGQASLCADDQGKFWEMHDLLFENQAAISTEKIAEFAEDIELDMDEFNACLSSEKYAEELDKTTAEGRAVGITGTPAFSVNGIMISGAQGFDAFKTVIDAELAK